jgi:glycosyltransferase involved in cell wall biosynthesis
VVAVSPTDRDEIAAMTGRTDIGVVPNGVDLSTFPFRPKKKISGGPVFLFVGNFSWLQNRDAIEFIAESLWSKIRDKFPGSSLRVVGKRGSADIRKSLNQPGITFLEHVSDIQEEYEKADVMLAPIRIGGGTKFKILEAMASGLPVVTTPIGAMGLSVVHNRDLVITHDETTLIAGVKRLVSDNAARLTMIRSARKLIEKEYSWDTIASELDAVWESYEKHN